MSKEIIEKILEETNLLCASTYAEGGDSSYAIVGGSDSFILVVCSTGKYLLEIFPIDGCEPIATEEFSYFRDACKAFKLLHTYRTLAILPVIATLTENI